MRNLLAFMMTLICLAGFSAPVHAAKPNIPIKTDKERLVLMPLRVGAADQTRQAAMETALVEGLQQKYEVFSGEQVAQKAKQIFLKESRVSTKKICDETRCMQDIAEAFQAELIATANVSKQEDGYFLVLSIQNIFDNKVVYSRSTPCQNCNAYQVVVKLKELSGVSAQVAQQELSPVANSMNAVPGSNAPYPESALPAEAKKGKTFKECADCPEMVVIPAGSFEMGSLDLGRDESPVHRVTISHPFAMGKTEVTQKQWQAIMGENPAEFKSCGDDCPVEQVSWDDAQAYIRKLNSKTGKLYRLPTEAEWEYACRAGGRQKYCGGDREEIVAWYKKNSRNTTHPAAVKQANAFGLYDMSGNVWEWVEDGYHDSYAYAPTVTGALLASVWENDHASFASAPVDGSAWLGNDETRVLRGGSWNYVPQFVRTASRMRYGAEGSSDDIGFRLARTLP